MPRSERDLDVQEMLNEALLRIVRRVPGVEIQSAIEIGRQRTRHVIVIDMAEDPATFKGRLAAGSSSRTAGADQEENAASAQTVAKSEGPKTPAGDPGRNPGGLPRGVLAILGHLCRYSSIRVRFAALLSSLRMTSFV